MITVTGQNLNIARSIDMVYILQCTRGSNSPWLITQVYLLYYFCHFLFQNPDLEVLNFCDISLYAKLLIQIRVL